MKKRHPFKGILCLLLVIFLSACASKGQTGGKTAGALGEGDRLKQENKRLVDLLRKTQEQLVITEAQLNRLKDSKEVNRKDYNLEAFPQRAETLLYFPIYDATQKGPKTRELYAAINSGTTLEEKLQKLTGAMAQGMFQNYALELVHLQTKEGKKIARINLQDNGDNRWAERFFRTSEDGAQTQKILISGLLQMDYTMDWIDGVEFTHNSQPITHEFVPQLHHMTLRSRPASTR
ncbi:hypothetical protein ABB02_00801 [Clostridiaceae bacterium JG1575]|nr:hypothetical protein ABB02_00801 [Clostridiaceae bacterium JG1575]